MAHEVLVPPLGQTTETVVFVKWYKHAGDLVKTGEPLFSIETDKATLDIEAQDSGVLGNIHASEGEEVKVLSPIATLSTAGETVTTSMPVAQSSSSTGEREVDSSQVALATNSVKVMPREVMQDAGVVQKSERLFVSPRARRLAAEKGVDLGLLAATGPQGAIVERDVRQYVKQQLAVRQKPVLVAQKEKPALASMVRSPEPVKQSSGITPPTTPGAMLSILNGTADIVSLHDLRRKLERHSLAISDDAVLVYVLGHALGEFQELGSKAGAADIDIGFLVASQNGFVAPVIHTVTTKGLGQLMHELTDLASRGQTGSLQPEELEGATLILASLGAYNLDTFTLVDPVMTPALGVGRIMSHNHQRDGQMREVESVQLSLSFDAQKVNSLTAVRFFQRVIQLIEDPDLLLG